MTAARILSHRCIGLRKSTFLVSRSQEQRFCPAGATYLCASEKRTFSSTPRALKKKKSVEPDNINGLEAGQASKAAAPDPFDFADLDAGILKAHDALKNSLSKLRAGGRFNPEVVESLRVQAVKGSSRTERLADLAQVVPRGRVLQIIVSDKEYMKPISSAIASSKLNLNPQPDANNPSQLNITLPPPTAESRKETVDAAATAAKSASAAVQSARAAQQKKLKAFNTGKGGIRPDDLRKAGTKMEAVVEKGMAEVKRLAENARKVLEAP